MLPDVVVKNIRYGLATNSSSSHSIIHNAGLIEPNEGGWVNNEFGWEFFTLNTKEEKEAYMQQQLWAQIPYEMYDVLAHLGVKNDGYIDHSSAIYLPKNKNGIVDIDFFKEYKDYIVQKGFVILGGNDNTGEDHSLAKEDDGLLPSYTRMPINATVWRNGNYWVVMNEREKLRVSFTDEPLRPFTPELIDLKITDYCDIGCPFCYQDSTIDGVHGDFEYIKTVINEVGYARTIEFAIGGGEPTTHPEFGKILQKIREAEHIANFTTKSTKWMQDEELVTIVKECVSGIAYSPNNATQAAVFIAAHDLHLGKDVKPYLHVIPELWSKREINKLHKHLERWNKWDDRRGLANVNLTLLGYKTTGRGESQKPRKKGWLIDWIQTFKLTQVGVDTKIVVDYKAELDATKIDSRLFTAQEGEFSMYIDAVKQTAYQSSYELDKPVETVKKQSLSYDKKRVYYTLHPMSKIFEEI